jgi:hypothetical protein
MSEIVLYNNDLLREIFRYLNVEQLKEIRFVSKTFYKSTLTFRNEYQPNIVVTSYPNQSNPFWNYENLYGVDSSEYHP